MSFPSRIQSHADLIWPDGSFKVLEMLFPKEPVLQIHDILLWIWIRICGSMSLTNGPGFGFGYGSCHFHH